MQKVNIDWRDNTNDGNSFIEGAFLIQGIIYRVAGINGIIMRINVKSYQKRLIIRGRRFAFVGIDHL